MRRNRVPLTAALLALCLLLASCAPAAVTPTGAPATSAPASDAPATAAPSAPAAPDGGEALPPSTWLTQEKAELTVAWPAHTWVTSIEENYATQWLENYTNVHINWTVMPAEELQTRLTLMMTTPAEMPDVFTAGIGRAQVDAYGSQGLLIPLQDYIDNVSVNYRAIIDENPEFRQQSVSFDGNIYFLSRYYETVHTRHSQKMWINEQWLENLGLPMPETTDEFYETLKAFKEQDANGNGDPNDEIPYITTANGWNGRTRNFLMNPFVYYPVQDSPLYVEDGTVKASYAQEGYKEGLKYFRRLYAEELLDVECLVITVEQVRALSSDPAGNRVGVFPGGMPSENVDQASPEIFNYTTLAPLTGPSGLKQAPVENVPPTPFFMITAACEDPELAFRWADIQMQDVAVQAENGDLEFLNFWYGPEDDPMGWSRAEPGETGFTGRPAVFKQNFFWGDLLDTHWYETFLINMGREWKEIQTSTPVEGVYDQERDLYEETIANYEPYAVDQTIPVLSMTPEDSAELAGIQTAINTYANESFAHFLTGDWDVDGQWDAYIAELDNIGLPRMLELNQIAYDRVYK